MKQIEFFNGNNELDEFPNKLVESEEAISSQEVDDYAKAIAGEYASYKKRKDKIAFIIDTLESDKIFDKFFVAQQDEFYSKDWPSYYERETVISRIRQAVVEKLSKYLDSNEYYLVSRAVEFKKGSGATTMKVFEGDSQKLLRRHKFYLDEDTGEIDNDYKIGLEKFLALKDRPEYFIDIKAYDPKDLKAIVNRLSLTNIDEEFFNVYYDSNNTEKPREYRLADVLRLFTDYLKGAIYLKNNGLILEDIALPNLGIDKKTGHGIFFDLEGLLPMGIAKVDRAHQGSMLPEARGGMAKEVTDKEMVFQLGECLQKISLEVEVMIYQGNENEKIKIVGGEEKAVNDIDFLAELMCAENPKDRIELEIALERIEEIIENIESFKSNERSKKAA